jgi:hypothetical protein
MKKITTFLIALTVFISLTGIAQAGSPVQPVPDVGATSSLLGFAVVGLVTLRRFLR